MRSIGTLKLTMVGAAAVAAMVAAWVVGLAWGFLSPGSLVGRLVHAPLGLPAYLFGVAAIFGIAAGACSSAGHPFFAKGNDAA
jgi:ABC-type sulfate transport system permease component